MTTNFVSYIFAEANDTERLALQHDCFKPNFEQIIDRVLDEYGLASRLEKAINAGNKLRILDVGCGEGLFLHDLAAILETRQLLEGGEFFGIDVNPAVITTAEAYSHASNPPRPYLKFFLHDATLPLEQSRALKTATEGHPQFDFILLSMVLEHLPDANQKLANLYTLLKPQGIIYTRDMVLTEGEKGWIAPHPGLENISRISTGSIRATNGGIDVSNETAKWLSAYGAEEVQAWLDIMNVGGSTKIGMQMLRNQVMILRNMAPLLIKKGYISQADFEESMGIMFREFGPHITGVMTFVDTLARKP